MRATVLLLCALTLTAQDPGRGVNFYSFEKEKALGEQLAREYRSQSTPLEDPEQLRRIEAIAGKIIPAGSRYTYSFSLVAEEGLMLNEPVAFPGGIIFVPSGLIQKAQNDDELAGMLAHAIAHIEGRHGSKQVTKEQIVNQATMPLIFMGGWTGFSIRQNTALAIPLGILKNRRAWELEADRLAAQYMRAGGYSPARLAEYIERIQPPDTEPPDSRSPLPSRTERVAALREAVR